MDLVVSDILARAVPGRKRSLDDKMVSVHVPNVKVSLLLDEWLTLADACDVLTVALGPSEEVEG